MPRRVLRAKACSSVAEIDGGRGRRHVVVADVGSADEVLFHQDAGFVQLVAGEGEHEHLADFFFGGHGANCGFDVHLVPLNPRPLLPQGEKGGT